MDLPPSAEWRSKWKEIDYSFHVTGLERAPEYMLITTTCGRYQLGFHVDEFKADDTGTCDELYAIKRSDFEEWAWMSYNPKHPQAEEAIFALLRGPLVHKCDAQAHGIGAVAKDDPRTSIHEVLDVKRIDETGCVLGSNAPAGGWLGEDPDATRAHGCAACSVREMDGGGAAIGAVAAALALAWILRRRRRRC